MSHIKESGILILSFSDSYSGLWVEGEQFLSSGRKSGPLLPTVSVLLAGPWRWSNAPPCLKKKHWLHLGCWPLSYQTGWATESNGSIEPVYSLRASETSKKTDPFLWLPLPSSSQTSAHIHVHMQHLQSVSCSIKIFASWWIFDFLLRTFRLWPWILAAFKWLFDYLAHSQLPAIISLCTHAHTHTHRAFLRTPFLNPAEVLTACLLLPGYSAVSFSHYSAQKYEIKCPRSTKALWELTSFSASCAVAEYTQLSNAVIYLLYRVSEHTQFAPFLAIVSSTVCSV